ncbi:hypothetical protein NC652_010013 [Populus alba x Populus x berolinensis]|nr:hypothetical protein NC652_010013 [Populus alba x Populus x berolinensis]
MNINKIFQRRYCVFGGIFHSAVQIHVDDEMVFLGFVSKELEFLFDLLVRIRCIHIVRKL